MTRTVVTMGTDTRDAHFRNRVYNDVMVYSSACRGCSHLSTEVLQHSREVDGRSHSNTALQDCLLQIAIDPRGRVNTIMIPRSLPNHDEDLVTEATQKLVYLDWFNIYPEYMKDSR